MTAAQEPEDMKPDATSGALKEDGSKPATGSATTSVGSSGNHGIETTPQADASNIDRSKQDDSSSGDA